MALKKDDSAQENLSGSRKREKKTSSLSDKSGCKITLSEFIYRNLSILGLEAIRTTRRAIRRIKRGALLVKWRVLSKNAILFEKWKARLNATSRKLSKPFSDFRKSWTAYIRRLKQAKQVSFFQLVKTVLLEAGEVIKHGLCISSHFVNYIAPVLGVILLVVTVNHFKNLTIALKVEYNGEQIGYVQDESVFDQADKNVTARIVYEDYIKPENAIPTFTLAVIDQEQITSVDTLTDRIIEASGNELQTAFGLYVDNKFQGAVPDDTLLYLLNDILEEYSTGDPTEKISFVNNVEVKEGLYPITSLVESKEIQTVLTSEVAGARVYTVVKGDAPTTIADKNDIPYADLKALNPGIETRLMPGQEVLIANSQPFLGVQVTRKLTYDEPIAFKTISTTDNSLYKGATKVLKKGKQGLAEITAEVTYVDGIETNRIVLDRNIVSEPIDQQVATGTSTPLVSYVSGSGSIASGFMWPVDGGYYSCGINGYYAHTGMDIAGTPGLPVRASASGTVIQSGWAGSYGYAVVINHGNGVITRYAHNSKLYVSAGQTVSQGDLIAGMGRTGNATGNHCHFEIKINGRFMDPAKYIGYYPNR